MEFDFQKFFLRCGIAVGLCVLAYKYYTPQIALDYTKRHPSYEWSPRIQYYVGLSAYLRDNVVDSEQAFVMLLTSYPTCQYAPYATYRLGNLYIERKRWPEAREMYEKYMELYPEGDKIQTVKNKYEFIKFR